MKQLPYNKTIVGIIFLILFFSIVIATYYFYIATPSQIDTNSMVVESNDIAASEGSQMTLSDSFRNGKPGWLEIVTDKPAIRVRADIIYRNVDDSSNDFIVILEDFEKIGTTTWRKMIAPSTDGNFQIKAYIRFSEDSLEEIYLEDEILKPTWNISWSPILLDGYPQDSVNGERTYDVTSGITNSGGENVEGSITLQVFDESDTLKQTIHGNKLSLAPGSFDNALVSWLPEKGGRNKLVLTFSSFTKETSTEKVVIVEDTSAPTITDYSFDNAVSLGQAFRAKAKLFDDSDVTFYLMVIGPNGETGSYIFKETEFSKYFPKNIEKEFEAEFIPATIGNYVVTLSACDALGNCNDMIKNNFEVTVPSACDSKSLLIMKKSGFYESGKRLYDFLNDDFCVTFWDSKLPPAISYLESFDVVLFLKSSDTVDFGFTGLEIPSTFKTNIVVEGPLTYYYYEDNRELLENVLKVKLGPNAFDEFSGPIKIIPTSHPVFSGVSEVLISNSNYPGTQMSAAPISPASSISSWNFSESESVMTVYVLNGKKRIFLNFGTGYLISFEERLLENILSWATSN